MNGGQAMGYALHETLELHEISAFKAICLTKSKTMQVLVSDPDLLDLLRADTELTTRQVGELDTLLARATGQEVKA